MGTFAIYKPWFSHCKIFVTLLSQPWRITKGEKKKGAESFRIKIKIGTKNRTGLLAKNLTSDASTFVLQNRLGLEGFCHWVFSPPHLMASCIYFSHS